MDTVQCRTGGTKSPTMNAVKVSGEKLKGLREQRFMSRAELAEKAGLHPDHIGRLERSEVDNSRLPNIRKIAEALGVEPSELVKRG